ncbi:MAG: DnaA N-terminal domain-containing protein, partial [Oscillibacter sp.]
MNSPADIWQRVLSLMEADMTATTIHTWFDDTEAVSLEEDRFVLYTPSDFKKDIIVSRYLPAVQKGLRELFSAEFNVVVMGAGEMAQHTAARKRDDGFLPGTDDYTFERFVVGSSNKFAHAAARAVADHPAQNY